MDAPDHEHALFLLDLPSRLGYQSIGRGYLARFQRAGKCARQSANGSRDHVVQRGGVLLLGRDAVVLGNGAMYPEHHRA
jgi:hypothetical protein